jgi:transposase
LLAEREHLAREVARLRAETESLRQGHDQLASELARVTAENERLRQKVDELSQELFGRSAEKIDPAELARGVEDCREPEAPPPPPFVQEAMDVEEKPKKRREGHGRRPLPASWPRERIVYELPPEALRCPQCGEVRTAFGEELTEEAEYVPASFRVVQHVRKKYRCACCQGEVVTAPLPPRPIVKGRPGPGLLAYVGTAKYADHLPLHRLERILAREGLVVRRSTLCDWVNQMADLLSPIVQEMKRNVKEGPVIGVDETEVLVRDEEVPEGIRKGRMWAYRGAPGDVVFVHTATKAGDGPAAFLSGYRGYVQADAANSYDRLFEDDRRIEVACWAHCRRKFFKAKDAFPREAGWALLAIRGLYAIEREAKDKNLTPDERLALRREKAASIVEGFFAWLKELKPAVPEGTLLATAVGYATNQEKALRRFLADGRLEPDNNHVERALRQVAVGRRSWLFAGSAKGAEVGAILYSLVGSCLELKLDPWEYLRDVLDRVSTHPARAVSELTPRGWLATRQRPSLP